MTTRGEVSQRVMAALREEEPESALHGAVHSLLSDGMGRRELYSALSEYRKQSISDDEDELILDIMAVLSGWASSTAVRNLLPPPCVAPDASRLD
jgi:hypothetical protein